MKIMKVAANNFQSYDSIEFTFSDLGLSLISGPTGAGKSTLMDLVSWTLFGVTGKDGAVDEVKSWNSEDPTGSLIVVDTPKGEVAICRIRGLKNDLHYVDLSVSSNPVRGKDLNDTQKLINARLGVTPEMFLLGSYLTQFSDADRFFIAKAKERREVLEKIADQDFAATLAWHTSDARKETKAKLADKYKEYEKNKGILEGLESSAQAAQENRALWEQNHKINIQKVQDAHDNFDAAKNSELKKLGANIETILRQIEALPINTNQDTKCPTCKRPLNKTSPDVETQKAVLLERLENLHKQHQQTEKRSNTYSIQLERIKREKNPFDAMDLENEAKLSAVKLKIDDLTCKIDILEGDVESLSWLYDKSFELRALIMERAVREIEENTNAYLEKYFDAALRIQLSLADSDKLNVDIYNDGNLASFRQLSGGERCMLKLCFSLSLMKSAQNKAGIKFNMIMLDEPLNGLDEGLKQKAFGLLQQLETEYETVLVIEHSEALKQCFNNVYTVEKNNGKSRIYKS